MSSGKISLRKLTFKELKKYYVCFSSSALLWCQVRCGIISAAHPLSTAANQGVSPISMARHRASLSWRLTLSSSSVSFQTSYSLCAGHWTSIKDLLELLFPDLSDTGVLTGGKYDTIGTKKTIFQFKLWGIRL